MSGRALLIHSGGLTSRQWRRLGEELARDHDVVAPDLIGYGPERWPLGTPFDFSQDVARLADLMGDRVHLVGHSYGGLLALQLALAHPDRVRSIAVYEPVTFGVLTAADAEARAQIGALPTYRPDPAGVDEPWLASFVDWWQGAGAWSRLPPAAQQSFRDVAWKLSEEVRSLTADTTTAERYATITAPTLLLAGDRTQPAELRVVERLVAALPNATLTVIAQAGHMGPITHAAEVNAAIAAHLRAH